MRTFTRAGLNPMTNMRRHFSQKLYVRIYAALRRAYRLGGDEAAVRVFNAAQNRKRAYSHTGIKIINAAWVTFCAVRRDSDNG